MQSTIICHKFHPKSSTEYDENISEVVKHLKFWAFLTSAVYHKAKVFQVCVKAEFIHSKLNNEESYTCNTWEVSMMMKKKTKYTN